jgi:hypothetical protein
MCKCQTKLPFLLVVTLSMAGCQGRSSDFSKNPLFTTSTTASASTSPTTAPSEPRWNIPDRPSKEDNHEALNNLFRQIYSEERGRVQNSLRTVIILRLSGATLFRNGKIVETVRVIPEVYHNLKYAAHVPFAIVLKMRPLVGQRVDGHTKAELMKYCELIRHAENAIPRLGLSDVQMERQKRIYRDALDYLTRVLGEGSVSGPSLSRYARLASIDVDANMREAGAAQVQGLHEQLLAWRKLLHDDEWNEIRFIIRGPQQQRGGYAPTIYLAALTNEVADGRGYLGESTRVIYREDTSLPPPSTQTTQPVGPPPMPWEADMRLLAAIVMDAAASDLLFSDPDRLAVDVASEGARARVRELDFSALKFTARKDRN